MNLFGKVPFSIASAPQKWLYVEKAGLGTAWNSIDYDILDDLQGYNLEL